ncbi:MAG TPA: tyrosine-protein phosphatase [Caulobacteraceae bacterium]|jgi:protein tyrosine/serine phosphatase
MTQSHKAPHGQEALAIQDLEGVVNFRDFGGHRSGDGRWVARGRLFRSGTPGPATDADLAALERIGLGMIVDLRRPAERQRDPARRPSGFGGLLIEHEGPLEAATAPHLAFLADPDVTEERILTQMTQGYRGYPFDPHYIEVYRRYFSALAATDQAVLIHCHAGKDRTGVLAALTLSLLGVSRADILQDYLETNRHNRVEARLPDLMARFAQDHGKPAQEALLRRVMSAEAQYLEAAFEAIQARCGAVEPYLTDVLGVDGAQRAQIQARLLRATAAPLS